MHRGLHTLAFLGYAIALIYATLILCPQRDPTPNFSPFRTISACWETGGRTMAVNILGNLALLAPVGMMLSVWWSGPRGLFGTAAAGLALSATIETTQYICGHRMADVDDVLLNTAGAALGYGAARLARRVARIGLDLPWPATAGEPT